MKLSLIKKFLLKKNNANLFYILFFLLLTALYLIYSWNKFLSNKKEIASSQAQIIRTTLLNNFEYANRVNNRIIEKIIEKNSNNLKNILDIFINFEKIYRQNSDLFSWSSYDFVDKNNLQLVNGKLGIRNPPPNMSHRQYTIECKKEPLKLKLSKPDYGEPSEVFTIPAGTGFNDKNKNFLGIIVVGFEIEKLRNNVSQNLTEKNIEFTVIDFSGNFIFDSSNNYDSNNDFFLDKMMISQMIKNPDKYKLQKANITYQDVKILEDYQYLILTGFKNNYLKQMFFISIKDSLIFFVVLFIFFQIVLILFKKGIFKIIDQEKELSRQLNLSNIAKSNLIRATGHDLKNYIFGISGILKILLNDEKINDENKELLKLADEQSDELVYFLEDLLDVNQSFDRNFTNEKFEKHNLNHLASRIILLNKSNFIDNKINIKTDFYEGLGDIFCDARRVKQIINNLLNNSIKYSSQKTTITIKTKNFKDRIILEIKDQGIGMSANDIKYALEGKHQFIDKSQLDKSFESYGIGLKNVQELLKQNNATLEIESAKGKGSTFRIIFPMIGTIGLLSIQKIKN